MRALVFLIAFASMALSSAKDFNCSFYKFFLEAKNQSYITCEFKDIQFTSRDHFNVNANQSEIESVLNRDSEDYVDESAQVEDLVTQVKFESSKISTIPNSIFGKFKHLQVLDGSHAELQSINSLSLNGAENLQLIFLQDNRLTIVNDYSFVHTKQLRLLDLSNNQISTIQRSAFNSLRDLQEMSLSNNKIKSLEDSTFTQLESLQWIWLDRNQLSLISSDLFSKANRNLRGIFLSDNEINIISPHVFDSIESMRFLLLEGNVCIDQNFKDHFIQDNASIKWELRECFKNYRELNIPADVKHNITHALQQVKEEVGLCINETLSFMSALYTVQGEISKLASLSKMSRK